MYAARPAITNGTIQPNRHGSIRNEFAIQKNPARKWPKPHHQPIASAERRRSAVSAAQISATSPTANSGSALTGGKARAASAPKIIRISRRDQRPRRRNQLWQRAANPSAAPAVALLKASSWVMLLLRDRHQVSRALITAARMARSAWRSARAGA